MAAYEKAKAEREAAEAAAAKAEEEKKMRDRIKRIVGESGMGDRFLRRTFSTFQLTDDNKRAAAAARRYAEGFDAMLPQPGRQEPGRNGLFIAGPPGTGKSMLAKRLPGILPPLTREEAVETTKIYSIAGQMPKGRGLITARPFRSPHHSASAVSLAGGGAQFRPGECSLANCGVLFLDELPEFSRESLEVLRQPLEDGQITVSRAAGSATYPSHFQLVAAMNPCKCGYYGHPTRQCTCSPSAVRQYRSRVSGPLLDRIDLCVEMDPVAFDELHASSPAESSAALRQQVLKARQIQSRRYAAPGFEGVRCNAQLTAGQVRRICRMTPGAEQLLRASYDALGLSARAHDRILRVARTVADLAGKQLLDEEALLEALQYRAQEKVETF